MRDKIKKNLYNYFKIYEDCLKLKIKSLKHIVTLLTIYITAIITTNTKTKIQILEEVIFPLLTLPYFLFCLSISVWIFNHLPKKITDLLLSLKSINFNEFEFVNKSFSHIVNYLINLILVIIQMCIVFIFIVGIPLLVGILLLKIPYYFFN